MSWKTTPACRKARPQLGWALLVSASFAFGRLCGSAVISRSKPHLVLAAYAAVNVALSAVVMGGGKLGLFALLGTFFFMSVMFPTIFRPRHPRLGRLHQAWRLAYRDVHRGRGDCGAKNGPHRGSVFHARRLCRPPRLLRLHRPLRSVLAKIGGQGQSRPEFADSLAPRSGERVRERGSFAQKGAVPRRPAHADSKIMFAY